MEFQLLNMISLMWIHIMEIFSLMFETERKVKLDHQICQNSSICFKDYNIDFLTWHACDH